MSVRLKPSGVYTRKITSFKQVATGDYQSCGLLHSGKVMCWQYYPFDSKDDYKPAFMSYYDKTHVEGVSQVAVGYKHACALIQPTEGNSSNGFDNRTIATPVIFCGYVSRSGYGISTR